MKVALVTGTSGSERIKCLEEIQEYAERNGKALEIINMWDVLNEVSPKPIDEATILNLPSHKRMSLLEKAYGETEQRLKKIKENEGQGWVLISRFGETTTRQPRRLGRRTHIGGHSVWAWLGLYPSRPRSRQKKCGV